MNPKAHAGWIDDLHTKKRTESRMPGSFQHGSEQPTVWRRSTALWTIDEALTRYMERFDHPGLEGGTRAVAQRRLNKIEEQASRKEASMKKKLVALIAAACAIATAPPAALAANVLQVKKSAEVDGKAADLWKTYGGFCAIADWHPAVVMCDESKEGDATFRTLTLGDGGKIKEKLTGASEDGYTYQIIESPLPVQDYNATFSIRPDDEPNEAKITWTATFMAKDKPDADAKSVILGIFDAGVKSIVEKIEGKK